MVDKEEGQGGEERVEFATLVLMLRTSGIIALGEIPDPVTGERKKDLDLASQNIAFLEMIEQKTKGNLTPAEAQLLSASLYELRMEYLQNLHEK